MLRAINRELTLRYKEYFESKFAVEVLRQPSEFSSVKKISAVILGLLKDNANAIIDLINQDSRIIDELREPYFGSLFSSGESVTAIEVLKQITSTLMSEQADLKKILQIHGVFIYRIHDHLIKRIEKKGLVDKLFPMSLFSEDYCGRSRRPQEAKEKNSVVTQQLGIAKPVFNKMIGQSITSHQRVIDSLAVNRAALFYTSLREKEIPTVCGPSGHAGSLMLGATLYGNLTPEELKEYAFMAYAFLTAGGHHSFHEVMVIANRVGVSHQENDYANSVPESIKQSHWYKEFRTHQFPEFLDNDCSQSFVR